jgi:hypothetical protein
VESSSVVFTRGMKVFGIQPPHSEDQGARHKAKG